MSERKYNTSRYKYTGPTIIVYPKDNPTTYAGYLLYEGREVQAEVNIGESIVISAQVDVNRNEKLEYVDIVPVYVCPKYLEPVKSEPIHFDPKDDEHYNTNKFFKSIFDNTVQIITDNLNRQREIIRYRNAVKCLCDKKGLNCSFKSNVTDSSITISQTVADGTQQEVFTMSDYGKDYLDLLKRVFKKLCEFYEITGDEFFTPQDVIDKLNLRDYVKPNENIEVGGQHYQTTIQPWDFIHIVQELTDTYKTKNHDYGNSFADLFSECGMTYAYGHLKEKLNRVKNMIDKEPEVRGEKMEDSLKDLANYAILTIMELRKEEKC